LFFKRKNMAKSSRFFLATMIGAVAGVIGGLLFAPQSGKLT
jgi:gas vesicle protein